MSSHRATNAEMLLDAMRLVSIAFRLSVQSPRKNRRGWVSPQPHGLHCLSAFCPVTAWRARAEAMRASWSPLPFGFLSSHRTEARAHSARAPILSPLPFGFLSSHRQARPFVLAPLSPGLHCLSAFCPVTAWLEWIKSPAYAASPLPFGFLSSHRFWGYRLGFWGSAIVSIAFRLSVQSPPSLTSRHGSLPIRLHCLSAFCPVTALCSKLNASRMAVRLHCLSAFCPVTAAAYSRQLSDCERESPLPFGFLSSHRIISWARARTIRSSPLPFGFLSSHRTSPSVADRLPTPTGLHCLSAFCPVTALPRGNDCVARAESPLPFGFLSSHRQTAPPNMVHTGIVSPLPFGFLSSHRWARKNMRTTIERSLHCLSAFCPVTASGM